MASNPSDGSFVSASTSSNDSNEMTNINQSYDANPHTFTPIRIDDDGENSSNMSIPTPTTATPTNSKSSLPLSSLADGSDADSTITNNHSDFPIAPNPDSPESDGSDDLDVNNLPETVSILKAEDGKTIYLVGTSHFSKQSHRDVRRVIRMVKPCVVVLELCRSRMCFISMDEKEIMKEAKSLDFSKILDYMKKNGFVQGFIYMLLLSASAKVTNDLELAPGGEFRNAFNEALKIPNCTVILGDRPVDITLRRAIARLSTWQKIKITCHCLFNNEKLNEEELERYKQADVLDQLVDELSEEFPGLSQVMVDERDSFLAHSLWSAANAVPPGSNIVGVVGIGHTAGIKNKWPNAKNIDVLKLIQIPEHRPSKTFLIIKYSFYATIAYGIYRYIIPNTIKTWTYELGHQVANKMRLH